jgi:hypothetical protein
VTTSDPLPDNVLAEDLPEAESDGISYRFVDRDIPDKNIPVRLLFASVPSLAWNGSSAAVVYGGFESGDDRGIGFIPLDAYGNKTGEETVMLEWDWNDPGNPMLSASDEGDFLFCTLTEASGDQIAVARISPAGQILSRGSTPASSTLINPLSPPVKVGVLVYAAAENRTPGSEGVEIYRFTWPDLVYDTMILVPNGESAHYDSPLLIRAPGSTDLLLFFIGTDTFIWYLEYSPELEYVTIEGPLDIPFRVGCYSAASNSERWITWALGIDYEGSTMSIQSLDSRGGSMSGISQADGYPPTMASNASDFPGWGASFGVHFADRWGVWVELEALPRPDYYLSSVMQADDPGIEGPDDLPWPVIAWTDGGFLVVWQQWRMDFNYSLFSSFIALEAEH